MARNGIGVDCGTDGVRVVVARRKGQSLALSRAAVVPFPRAAKDGSCADPVSELISALADIGAKGSAASVGISGRDVVLRYTQVPAVSPLRLKTLMGFEIREIAEKAGGDVVADYGLIAAPEDSAGEGTVLVGLAKEAFLAPRIDAIEKSGIRVRGACPASIAVFNCFLKNGDFRAGDTTLLLDIGAENLDIAIQRDGDLLFARNVSAGGRLFTEAVMGAFGATYEKAESLKIDKGSIGPRPPGTPVDPAAEKVGHALRGVAGQILSAVQSSIQFCRTQARRPDLRVDRVVLSGGGAALGGLGDYLSSALEMPCEIFDPLRGVDLSSLPAAEREAVEAAPHEFVVALGLAEMGLDERFFRLEILPESARKKRTFRERTLFLVAAGVVAIVFLGAEFAVGQRNRDIAERRYDELRSTKSRYESDRTRFAALVDGANDLAAKLDLLSEKVAPGTALACALAMVQEAIPPELWLQKVSVRSVEAAPDGAQKPAARDAKRGDAKRGLPPPRIPVVVIDGAGRESEEDVQKVAGDFARRLREDARVADSRMRYDPGKGTFQITLEFKDAVRPAPAEGGGETKAAASSPAPTTER